MEPAWCTAGVITLTLAYNLLPSFMHAVSGAVSPEVVRSMDREVEIAARMRHPRVALLLGFCMDPPCLVTGPARAEAASASRGSLPLLAFAGPLAPATAALMLHGACCLGARASLIGFLMGEAGSTLPLWESHARS